jgi:flagellar motility protein MotE (MotC chaperone)
VSKKLIIVIAVAGLISFAGAFCYVWFVKSSADGQGPEAEAFAPGPGAELSTPETAMEDVIDIGGKAAGKGLKQQRFEELIYDVRQKIDEYNNKMKDIEVNEQRIKIAQEQLKKDIDKLNELRVELAGVVASVRSERQKLLDSRVKIAKAENENLMKIAATYDKMDAASAGKILTSMSKMQGSGDGESSFDDAVKILHYMTERTKAKLLAELVVSEPKLAAVLCQRLKRVAEEE